MTIGDRIKLRRKELHLTQNELALRMGYTSRTAICTVEKNKEDLTTTRVKKFAEALETTPAYLMGWSNEHVLNNDFEKNQQDFWMDLNEKLESKKQASGRPDIQELIDVAKHSSPEDVKIAIAMLKGLNASK